MVKQKRLASVLVSVVLLALPVLVWYQRYTVYDWWRLRGYNAPAHVATLASDTTMTDEARHLFYVYHPSLEDRSTFNQHCMAGEKTIVLGCYVPARGIYLYDITDARLDGVEQVTAAHEMLHAAFARLSPSEKKRVTALINQAYNGVSDERIRKTVDDYRNAGADVTNELHSILGTEVGNLPPELETYYKQYFTNRAAIVAFSNKYETAFASRETQVTEGLAKLKDLKDQITNLESSLTSQEAALTAQRQRMEAYRSSGQLEQYNALVPGYNAKVKAYNAGVSQVQAVIDQHNKLVETIKQLATEENELLQAIDSRPGTVQN